MFNRFALNPESNREIYGYLFKLVWKYVCDSKIETNKATTNLIIKIILLEKDIAAYY